MKAHRAAVSAGIALACLGLSWQNAFAASGDQPAAFPARPLRLVVPFPPGAGADVVARLVAQPMSERLRQPIVVDNRSGASGTMGTSIVAKAPPDGYTMILVTATFSISAAFYKSLPYDPVADFAPVGRIATGPVAVVVNPSLQAHTLKDLVALAKAQPGKLNYASGGQGGINHLAAEMLNTATGMRTIEIPYKGGGPALTGLLSGEAQMMAATLGSCLAQVRSGKLRALALGSNQRSALLPQLPTVAESGFPGYEAETWYAVLASRGTPHRYTAVLNQAMVESVRTRDIEEKLAATGFEPSPSSSAEFAAYLKSEIAKWARAIKAAGIARS
jgi:tripartite-type tricarboxylate transporter receptor subunit TctC